jgi:hypothetical protein
LSRNVWALIDAGSASENGETVRRGVAVVPFGIGPPLGCTPASGRGAAVTASPTASGSPGTPSTPCTARLARRHRTLHFHRQRRAMPLHQQSTPHARFSQAGWPVSVIERSHSCRDRRRFLEIRRPCLDGNGFVLGRADASCEVTVHWQAYFHMTPRIALAIATARCAGAAAP